MSITSFDLGLSDCTGICTIYLTFCPHGTAIFSSAYERFYSGDRYKL